MAVYHLILRELTSTYSFVFCIYKTLLTHCGTVCAHALDFHVGVAGSREREREEKETLQDYGTYFSRCYGRRDISVFKNKYSHR